MVVVSQSGVKLRKKCTHNSIIKRTLRPLIARIAGGWMEVERQPDRVHDLVKFIATIPCTAAFYRATDLQDLQLYWVYYHAIQAHRAYLRDEHEHRCTAESFSLVGWGGI